MKLRTLKPSNENPVCRGTLPVQEEGKRSIAKFNSEVEDAVQEAMDELEGESRPSQSVERAKAALLKSLKKVQRRLIKG